MTHLTSRPTRRLVATAIALLALAASLSPRLAAAQGSYPSKPVRLVVPFAPGGTTDIVARVMSDALGRALGQTVVVDNKAGGGGLVGTLELVRSAPDGYTLGMATVSTTAAAPAVNPKPPYNPVTDLSPIINIAATPNVLLVHPSFPAHDYKAVIEELRRNPGKHSHVSGGMGSISHLQMELFKSLTGTTMTHIPYRGEGPMLNDVVAGLVPILFGNLPSSLPHIQSGKLIPIAVAAPKRLANLPDVPTFEELGMPQMNRMAYFGIAGPKGLPREVITRVNAAVRKAMEDPAVQKRIVDVGAIAVANTPGQFAQQIKEEFESYRKIVVEKNISLEN
jgi:tripartite-type tricarboxylate transporter receptor subunit TctC